MKRPDKNDYPGMHYPEYFDDLETYADYLEDQLDIPPFEVDDPYIPSDDPHHVPCYDDDERVDYISITAVKDNETGLWEVDASYEVGSQKYNDFVDNLGDTWRVKNLISDIANGIRP